jgi:hypothetical protein
MMAIRKRRVWVNVLAGALGGVALGMGVGRLYFGFTLWGLFWAVLGFLIIGWSVFDQRASRPGNPESEIRGGRNIE